MPANKHFSHNRMRYEKDGVHHTLIAAVAVVKNAREIWVPYRNVAEDSSLPGNYAVSTCKQLTTFRKTVLPSPSMSSSPTRKASTFPVIGIVKCM
jgi:hypothetical protein